MGWVGWRSDWVGGWWGRRQPRHWAKWLEHSFPPHLHHSACHPNHIILHHTPPPPPFPPHISLPPLPTVPPPVSLHTPPPPPPPQSVSMSYSTMFSNHHTAAARFIVTFDSFSSNFVFTAGPLLVLNLFVFLMLKRRWQGRVVSFGLVRFLTQHTFKSVGEPDYFWMQ